MRERDFWKRLKEATPTIGWQRIENRFNRGVPDVHYIISRFDLGVGVAGWLELKVVKNKNCIVQITQPQINWLKGYWERGGMAGLLVLDNSNLIISLHLPPALKLSTKLRDLELKHAWRLSDKDFEVNFTQNLSSIKNRII